MSSSSYSQVLYRAALTIVTLSSAKLRTTKDMFEGVMYLRNDVPVAVLQSGVFLPAMLRHQVKVQHMCPLLSLGC